MRFRRAAGLGILFLVLSGCMAVEVPEAAGVTYKNSWLNVLLLLGIAGAFGVFGVGMVWESAKPMLAPKPKRKKGSSRPVRAETSPKQIGVLAVGGLLTAICAILLLLGVPSSMLAYVTVGQDRVILRDHLFWFAERPREIPFSDLSNIEVEEVQQLARRGTRKKEYMYISHSAGVERIEMAAIHKAARAKLEDAWRQYRTAAATAAAPAAEPAVAQVPAEQQATVAVLGEPPPGEAPPVSEQPGAAEAPPRPDEAGLTPVAHIGRFVPGMRVTAPREGGSQSAVILEVYQERKLKVHYERDPAEAIVPLDTSFISATSILAKRGEGPGQDVTKETPLAPGQKLLGHHAGGWFPAEVLSVAGDGGVVISWDGERGRHNVPRSWLRIPNSEPVTAILPSAEAGTTSAKASVHGVGRGVSPRDLLAPGESLLAEWAGKWIPVTVLEVQPDGQVKIHWEGYADNFDEALPRKRLRFPKKAR